MLPVEVLVPGANSRSTCKHCGIYTGPSLLEPYKSHNNIYIYKAAYNNMMNHVIIFLVIFTFYIINQVSIFDFHITRLVLQIFRIKSDITEVSEQPNASFHRLTSGRYVINVTQTSVNKQRY